MKARLSDYLADNVQVIYDKLFPLYLVRGERNFLIDSGTLATFHSSLQKINQVLLKDKVDCLLLTHSHWDHTGASREFQKIFNFKVFGSGKTIELLKKRKVVGFIDRLNQDYKKMLNDHSDTCFGPLDNLAQLREGEKIPIDKNGYFQVISTPGHTRCSVSYMMYPDQILFPGDAAGIADKTGTIIPLFLSNYSDYEKSIKKLITFQPSFIALPHNLFITGQSRALAFLQKALSRTHELRDEILSSLQKTNDFTQIAEQVLENGIALPGFMGPREALMINLIAMVRTVYFEFVSNNKEELQ